MAGFDVRPEVVGKAINGIPVYSMDDFSRLQAESPVPIGILTVPVEKAQLVADQIIEGGIQAIWNFTPYRINVSEHIVVQNTSIYAHLALMFNRLEQLS
jgi:redox-sensing transcriptional repressor